MSTKVIRLNDEAAQEYIAVQCPLQQTVTNPNPTQQYIWQKLTLHWTTVYSSLYRRDHHRYHFSTLTLCRAQVTSDRVAGWGIREMAEIYSPPNYSQIYYPPHYRAATADPEILCNMLNVAHRHFEQFTSTVSSPILSSIPPPHLILATVPYSAILQVQRVTTRRAVVLCSVQCALCKANCGVYTVRTWWSGVKCAGPLICVKCKV